jgi:hypothetical protein
MVYWHGSWRLWEIIMYTGHYYLHRNLLLRMQKERGANDITKEERTKILEGVENYPLPEGVFFNGAKYVNWEGETLKEHPCMPEMIEDFLKAERVGITHTHTHTHTHTVSTLRAHLQHASRSRRAVSVGSVSFLRTLPCVTQVFSLSLSLSPPPPPPSRSLSGVLAQRWSAATRKSERCRRRTKQSWRAASPML